MNKLNLFFAFLFISYLACISSVQALEAQYTSIQPVIDGKANEPQWGHAPWHYINTAIIGELPTEADFSGRYKVLWHESALYLLVEIIDDVFFDQEINPLKRYWDDDCLEVFIDEDFSGGEHLYNFNAFAYHVALDGNVVDIVGNNKGKDGYSALFNEHIINQYSVIAKDKIIWELAVKVYADDYQYGNNNALPVKLVKGKTLGFMLSYCDNDSSPERESFIGSIDITPQNGSKNLGYITADVFDKLILIP